MSLWLFRHRIFVPVLNVSDVPPCGIVGFSEVEILVRFNTLWPSKGYRLVFGDECNPPGNLVHRELRPDPPPGDPGTYASWVQQALYESYDEVRAQHIGSSLVMSAIYQETWSTENCAQTHHQETQALTLPGCNRPSTNLMMRCARSNKEPRTVRNATTIVKRWSAHSPFGCWTLRYYPPARKNKLCSPWIGPYKIVRAPMEWVVGLQVDADACIVYVHMDDLKRCATPDPEPSWPDTARGTSIVVSTRAPSTFATQVTHHNSHGVARTIQTPSHQEILMCAHQTLHIPVM